ncbi:MAG: tRNA (adenosine(37)-N6)-threonylcarbamoyltransferase complex dimerization subunit type 1 TsaB [Candidatus Hydrogenedentota bacterium]|nr:MAG: tRNA (adenosine(37)-N6)-threonylcarbamoyltransferase complex dimerization subunit type 1 TsaB [Candidatus Hydrogenedentota bacterium]
MRRERLLLAIDTVSPATEVRLLGNGGIRERVVGEEGGGVFSRRGKDVAPLVADLLRRSGLELTEIAGVAVTIGPGSYTGIRVGVAAVQGLFFGTDVSVYPLSTFALLEEVLEREKAGEGTVAVQTRRNEWAVRKEGQVKIIEGGEWSRELREPVAVLGTVPEHFSGRWFSGNNRLLDGVGRVIESRALLPSKAAELEPWYVGDCYAISRRLGEER